MTHPCTSPNLLWPLRRAAQLRSGGVAVVDGAERLTYPELLDRVHRYAGGLAAAGVERGGRVAVLGSNSVDYLAAYFGVPAYGRVFVPLNARLADAELAAVFADADPALVVSDHASAGRATLFAAAAGVPCATFGELNRAEPIPGSETEAASDELAAIFYTGGSTGRAKGAMLSHANLAANSLNMIAGLGYRADDVYLHASPMFHLGDGMSLYPVTWAAGGHVVIPRFEPGAFLRAVEEEGVTCTFLVPTMLTLLLEHIDDLPRRPDLSTLRLVVHGGAPIAAALLDRAMETLGCSFTQSYGMTEAGPILSFLDREETRLGRPELDSAGRPVAGVEVRIVRTDDVDCDPGETGEIIARGPTFASGYWRQPEVTASRFRDGWYRSGDLAYRDDDWYMYIVGRQSDTIISGGENVYAAEVEAALASHPDVVEAAVIAVPSAQWGERVHAAVVLRSGSGTTTEGLDRHCRGLIAGYKVPRSYDFHPLLPRNGTGKLDRLALRRPYWDGRERGVS
jgi:long-chain acyl-CoA synthetase